MNVSVRARGAASAFAFAHLLGFDRKPKSTKGEEDDKKDDPDASEEEDDEDDKKDKDSKKSKKAEDDNKKDDPDASEEEGDEDDEKDKDSKKSKKAKGDDETCEDDEEDEEASAAAVARSARLAERSRWSKVLSHAAAGEGRVGAACQLLSTTSMNASAIIATLESLPAGGRQSLHSRMEGQRPGNPGADGGQSPKPGSSAAMAAAIVAAGKKRRGEPT